MNKLTKLLSVFVIAGAIGTGIAGVSGCKKSKGHSHSYQYTVDVEDSTKHNGVCDCGKDPILKEGHTDEKDGDGKCDLCGATIQQQSSTPTVSTVTVTAAGGATSVKEEATLQLSASVTGTNSPAQTVTWSSSDDSKATVSNTGLVTGVAAGTVTITATSTVDTTKKGTIQLSVTEKDEQKEPGDDPNKPAEKTVYQTLMEKSDKLVALDSTYTEGSKLATINGYATKGIYFRVENETTYDATRDYIDVVKEGEELALQQHASDGKTQGLPNIFTEIVTGQLKGTVEGYLETKISALASSDQSFIKFKNDDTDVLALGLNNGVPYTKVGSGAATPVSGLTVAKDTYVSVYFKFDLETGKTTLKLNDTVVALNDADTGITSLSCIELCTTNKGGRQHTTKKIVVCGAELDLATYQTKAKADLKTKHDSYTTEGEGAEYTQNKTVIDTINSDYDKAIDDATTIAEAQAAYSEAMDKYKGVLKDSEIAEKRTAAKDKLAVKFPSTSYTIAFDDAVTDSVYNNTAKYAQEIAAIEAQIDAATTQYDLDALVANASLTIPNDAAQVEDKKKDNDVATYRTDVEIPADKTAIATAIQEIRSGIAADIQAVIDNNTLTAQQKIAGISEVIATAKAGIDSQIASLTETIEQTKDRLKGDLTADGTAEKAKTEDETVKAAIDAAVTAGHNAIDGESVQDNLQGIYDAQSALVKAVIAKAEAKAELATYYTTEKAKILGTGTAVTTANTDIDSAKSDGDTAIEGAANATAVAGALANAKTAIDAVITTLYATEFDVTVNVIGGSNISNGLKVKYGGKLVKDESKLTLTNKQMIGGWYADGSKAELDLDTVYYAAVTVYVEVVEAKELPRTEAFKYSDITPIDNDVALAADAFTGDNAFLTLGSGEVRYRTDVESSRNLLQVTGEIFKVEFKGTGTLVIGGRGTGNDKNAAIAVYDENGVPCALSTQTLPSGVTAYDDNVYSIASKNHVDISFSITKPGTYSIVVLRNGDSDPVNKDGVKSTATFGMARISKIEINETYKVALDVTVNWGSQTVKYYHDEEITAPTPTGLSDTEKFVHWYKQGDEQDVWTDGTKLAAGTYTYVAKTETVAAVASVEVSAAKDATEIELGGKLQFTAVAKSESGETLEGRTVEWSVTQTDKAEISDSGELTLKAAAAVGDTITVTAKIGSQTASLTITVKEASDVDDEVDISEDTKTSGHAISFTSGKGYFTVEGVGNYKSSTVLGGALIGTSTGRGLKITVGENVESITITLKLGISHDSNYNSSSNTSTASVTGDITETIEHDSPSTIKEYVVTLTAGQTITITGTRNIAFAGATAKVKPKA
ncbi:MAG: Ig-like domain-containing protein [Roseburia sp.]|nr:Ig-like domain-containing protein [Roseburia sp.]